MSKDGEFVARATEIIGRNVIRGSSAKRKGDVIDNKGALAAVRDMINVAKSGNIAIITPDGPKGPRHSVAEGIVLLAQKTGLPVVCYNYDASKKWRLRSWDRFIIPKPFCTLSFIASKPIYRPECSNPHEPE